MNDFFAENWVIIYGIFTWLMGYVIGYRHGKEDGKRDG